MVIRWVYAGLTSGASRGAALPDAQA